MELNFQSRGLSCAAELLSQGDTCLIRFFDSAQGRFSPPLHDLVIVPSSLGFLHLRRVGEDAVLDGLLDQRCFSPDMTEDLLSFLEEHIPWCKDVYLPYHIDFVALTAWDEYNGEY